MTREVKPVPPSGRPLSNDEFWSVVCSDRFITDEDADGVRKKIREARQQLPVYHL